MKKIKILEGAKNIAPQHYFGDVGHDIIYFGKNFVLNPGITAIITTDIKAIMNKKLYVEITGRSSIAKNGLIVHGGIIDSGYEGLWNVIITNTTKQLIDIIRGDKIAQFIVKKHVRYSLVYSKQNRKSGKFGSTGK